jgi:hypothetical protein
MDPDDSHTSGMSGKDRDRQASSSGSISNLDMDQDDDLSMRSQEREQAVTNYEGRTTWGYGEDAVDRLAEEGVEIPGVDDLPLFVNQATKELNKQIHDKERTIVSLEGQLSDLRDRVKVMKEHFKNVQSELLLTNNVNSSKKMEIQTERHMQMLVQRSLEKERLNQKKLVGE